MSCIIRCVTEIEKKYICSKPLKIDFMRKACINNPPSICNQPPKQNLAVECRKKNTKHYHYNDFKTTPRITTCYYTKTYCIFCKNKQKKPTKKKPKNIPKILKIIIILEPEMNVTCKRDESIQLIHLCLCKLKVKHTHTVLLNSLPDTTDLCQWQRLWSYLFQPQLPLQWLYRSEQMHAKWMRKMKSVISHSRKGNDQFNIECYARLD